MNRIKQLRKAKGLTQAALAEKLDDDVTQTAISQWETGVCKPRADRLAQLAVILGTTAPYLLGEDTAEQTPTAPVEVVPALTDDEKHLLDCFRSVGESGKRMILSVADLEYERLRNEIVG